MSDNGRDEARPNNISGPKNLLMDNRHHQNSTGGALITIHSYLVVTTCIPNAMSDHLIVHSLLVNKFNYTIISVGSIRVLEVQELYKNSHYLEYI